jgi:hypothetical protein
MKKILLILSVILFILYYYDKYFNIHPSSKKYKKRDIKKRSSNTKKNLDIDSDVSLKSFDDDIIKNIVKNTISDTESNKSFSLD